MDIAGLKTPQLLHVGNGRSDLIRSFTALAKLRVITHPRIMLLYLIIAFMDLVVTPGGIQYITQVCLLMHYGMHGLLRCLTSKSLSRKWSPPLLNHHPQCFLLKHMSGESRRGIALNHRSHPTMTRCQMLTQLG